MNKKHLLPLPVLALAAMFYAPVAGNAQSILGLADDFAILGGTTVSFGGVGAIVSNGHVGSEVDVTGPVTVSGGYSVITPALGPTALLIPARDDFIIAHTALLAMTSPPANDLTGVDLVGMSLSPGVYSFGIGAGAMSGGTLTFDAGGQNGVFWVIQIGTSFTSQANATMVFANLGSNGGNDNGIFWAAGASFSFGNTNTLLGNFLAGMSISHSGATSTIGSGRALAQAGVTYAGGGVSFDALAFGGLAGGLMYNGLGQLIPIPAPSPPAPVFTGNVILSSPGAFAPGASGVTLVPGTEYPTTTLTLDGNSSNGTGPASLTINTATVTMTGTGNTYTGGTVVNSGALIATNANLPVNGAVALNSSTLTFNQPANGTFGGVISGNGSVNKQGAGALTVTGASTYTGGTAISAGSLIASTTSLPANGAVSVNGTGTLVFNQAATGSFGGAITGGGRVQKTGTGALTLTTTTTSPVDVQAGSFFFSTGIGATTVSSGATLGGTGTITGNLVNNGTVSPGTSPGTINVTGNYTQSSTGLLFVEIASAASFDRLVMTGTAALAGTLQYQVLGTFNPLGQSFTFLTAPGGVSGTFGTLSGAAPSAATSVSVVYAPTTATLVFSQLPFAGFAQTPNQISTANAAQGSPALTSSFNAIPSAGQFPGALNAVSPQDYQVWSDFAFAHSTAMADRLLQSGRLATGCDDFYFEGGQRRGRARFDGDLGSSRYTASTGLVGGNHTFENSNSTVGAFFGFGKTTAGLGSGGVSNTSVKNKTLGVRSAWTRGSAWSEAILAYGWDKYTSTRAINFPGTSVVAASSTRGNQWTAGMTIGQDIKNGNLTVSPFGGLLASRWKANSFTETGAGIYSATLGSQRADSVRSQLGAEARLTLGRGPLERTATTGVNPVVRRSHGWIQPHVRAAWLHEFYNDSRSMHASFADSGVYSLMTRRAPRNAMLYSAGVDLRFAPNALLYTDFAAQYGGGDIRVLNEWRVGLAISF